MTEALAGRADCFVLLGHYGYMDTASAYGRARADAQRALEIDPELADAYATLGWIEAFFDWRWDGAEHSFQRSLALDPNCPTAWEWYGIHWLSRGRLQEALSALREAWRLDPLSLMVGTILGWASFEAGQHEEAERVLATVTTMDPRFVFAQNVLGSIWAATRRETEAIDVLERAVALSGREGLSLAFLAFGYGQAGRVDDVNRVVAELETARADGQASAYHLALAHVGAGRTRETLDWLEEAVAQRDSFFATTHFSFVFDGLREEPRFEALLREMDLPGAGGGN